MFVERLTKQDIINFLTREYGQRSFSIPDFNDFSDPTHYENANGKIAFYTKYSSYFFNDFDFANVLRIDFINGNFNRFNRSWYHFMYQRFGKEYKTAWLKDREKYKKTIIQKFDEETLDIKSM